MMMRVKKGNRFEIILIFTTLVWLFITTFHELQAASSPTTTQMTSSSSNLQVQQAVKAPLVQSSREIEKQIVDKILGEGYDKRIRPAGTFILNASKPGGGM